MDSYFIHNKNSRTCRLHLSKESSCCIRLAEELRPDQPLSSQADVRGDARSCLHSSVLTLHLGRVFCAIVNKTRDVSLLRDQLCWNKFVILCLTRHKKEAPPAGDSQSLHVLNEPLSQSLIINILIHAISENGHNDEVTSCL